MYICCCCVLISFMLWCSGHTLLTNRVCEFYLFDMSGTASFNLLMINSNFLHVDWIGNWNLTQCKFDEYSDLIMILIGMFGFSVVLFVVTGYQMGEATIFFNDIPNQ
eukprot:357482_1